MILNIDKFAQRIREADYQVSKIRGLEASLSMPAAANIYEWLMDPKFCRESENFKPWPKQLFILASVLEEYCPMPACTDKRFFDTMFDQDLTEVRERVTFLEYGVCPNCGGNKLDYLHDGLFHDPVEMAICLGQRSSKTSMIAGFMSTYILHRFVSLPGHPSQSLGMKPGQKLYAHFVAHTKDQAFKYPWQDFVGTYKASAWFRNYNKEVADLAAKEGWENPVNILETRVDYKHKGLTVEFDAPNKRKLRGATRFFAMIDEFGFFSEDDSREAASATETQDALGNALTTVRSGVRRLREQGNLVIPQGILAKSSSPHYVGDPILSSVYAGKKSPHVFVLHAPTWEVNPQILPPWDPKSELRLDFELRPEFAERSFGAAPPLAREPFHKNKDLLEHFGQKGVSQIAKVSTVRYTDKVGVEYVAPKVERFNINPDSIKHIPMVLSVDPGEKKNSFGFSVCHLRPTGEPQVLLAAKVDPFYFGRQMSVNFQQALELAIFPLIEELNILAVIYDRWQSTSHINQINDNAKFAERTLAIRKANPRMVVSKRDRTPTIGGAQAFSLRYSDFLEFDAALSGLHMPEIELPFTKLREMELAEAFRDRPLLELTFQIGAVRERGARVTKPENGDDDIYRSVVNAVTYMRDPQRVELFTNHSGANLGGSSGPRTAGFRIPGKRGGGQNMTVPRVGTVIIGRR